MERMRNIETKRRDWILGMHRAYPAFAQSVICPLCRHKGQKVGVLDVFDLSEDMTEVPRPSKAFWISHVAPDEKWRATPDLSRNI